MTTIAIVLVNMGGACLLVSMALMYQEIGEVNRKLPDDRQISYFWFYAEKVSRIRREYRRLYPQSSIDRYQVALGWLGPRQAFQALDALSGCRVPHSFVRSFSF
jgi:hypothetical protein